METKIRKDERHNAVNCPGMYTPMEERNCMASLMADCVPALCIGVKVNA